MVSKYNIEKSLGEKQKFLSDSINTEKVIEVSEKIAQDLLKDNFDTFLKEKTDKKLVNLVFRFCFFLRISSCLGYRTYDRKILNQTTRKKIQDSENIILWEEFRTKISYVQVKNYLSSVENLNKRVFFLSCSSLFTNKSMENNEAQHSFFYSEYTFSFKNKLTLKYFDVELERERLSYFHFLYQVYKKKPKISLEIFSCISLLVEKFESIAIGLKRKKKLTARGIYTLLEQTRKKIVKLNQKTQKIVSRFTFFKIFFFFLEYCEYSNDIMLGKISKKRFLEADIFNNIDLLNPRQKAINFLINELKIIDSQK